jgi:TatD DNase family protein
MYIDTHAHIYLPDFSKDINEVMDRSLDEKVYRIYMPNIDSGSIDEMLETELKFPEICIPMIGLHPCSIGKKFEQELYIVEDWLTKREFAGVGEIGTDLYWDKTYWAQQQEALRIQLNWAKKYKIPAIIHCRDSIDETIKLVSEENSEELSGIFHCFTGTVQQAKQIIEVGFKIGVGGVSTFKNGGMEEVLNEIGLEHMVLETDSPYLSPVPFRGQRNEPSRTSLIANRISELRNIDVNEVAEVTTDLANKIFSYHAV